MGAVVSQTAWATTPQLLDFMEKLLPQGVGCLEKGVYLTGHIVVIPLDVTHATARIFIAIRVKHLQSDNLSLTSVSRWEVNMQPLFTMFAHAGVLKN